MTTPRRAVVLGAGLMGVRHAAAVRTCGDEVVAVVDSDPARAAALAQTCGAQPFEQLAAAIAATRPDAAVVATPSAAHLDQAVELVAAGVDALVEKPHRLPDEDPQRLHRLLEVSPTRYRIGLSERFDPGIRAVARAARSGVLGELTAIHDHIWYRLSGQLPAWYFDRAFSGGGLLLTNGVHALDRARWILGEELTLDDVRVHFGGLTGDVEDHAELRLRSQRGVPVAISLLWTAADVAGPTFAVVGSAGVAEAHLGRFWRIATDEVSEDGVVPGEDAALVAQWKDFRDPTTSDLPSAGLADGEAALRLIHEAYAHAR